MPFSLERSSTFRVRLILGAALAGAMIGCADDRQPTISAPPARRSDVDPGLGVVAITGIRDLGIPAGWESSVGQSINDAGVVAGFSTGGGFTGKPWRWKNGAFAMLTLPSNLAHGRALSINAFDQIAGHNYSSGGKVALRWNESNAPTVLAAANFSSSGLAGAMGINDNGNVVGRSWLLSNEAFPGSPQDPCCGWATVWFANGQRRQLAPLAGGNHGGANAINNMETVAGWATSIVNGTTIQHAAIWNSDGIAIDLGVVPGGTFSEATAINDRGVVAGWSTIPEGTQAFVWKDGVLTPLPFLDPAGKLCRAFGINEYAHIVGSCSKPGVGVRPVLWRNGTVTDLGTLPGDVSGSAADINSQGQITGISGPGGGDFIVGHAVVWSYTVTPTDPLSPSPVTTSHPQIATDAPPIVDDVMNSGLEVRPHLYQVSNAGTGTLSGLSIGPIEFDESGNTGWLSASLTLPLAPTGLLLTLRLNESPLVDGIYPSSGVYTARVPVVSTASGVTNSPYYVRVRRQVGTDDAWRTFTPAAPPTFTAAVAGAAPPDFTTPINTTGFFHCGSAQLMVTGIRYPVWEPSGWLTASVNGFSLTLRANQGSLTEGSYSANVSLTLVNGAGCGVMSLVTRSFTTTLVVGPPTNRAPVVSTGGPYAGSEGSPITFAITASDPDGDALSYTYDFGDGTTGTGLAPASHTYDDNGTYSLRVTASDGRTSTTSTATVTVGNTAPTASIVGPPFVRPGATYALTLLGDDASAADRASLQFVFDCGNGFGQFSASASTNCVAPAFGQANVQGRVMDKDGGAFTRAASIPVQNVMDVQPNTISLSATGTVSVYLYSTPGFDAVQMSAATTRLRVVGTTLAGAPVMLRGTTYTTSVGDYNGDGRTDRLFVFARTALQAAGLTTLQTSLILEDATGTWRFQATDLSPPAIVP